MAKKTFSNVCDATRDGVLMRVEFRWVRIRAGKRNEKWDCTMLVNGVERECYTDNTINIENGLNAFHAFDDVETELLANTDLEYVPAPHEMMSNWPKP